MAQLEDFVVSNVAASEWVESRFPFYSAESIHSLYSTASSPILDIEEDDTALIAVASGEGHLQAGGDAYELKPGSLVLLPANCRAALIANRNRPLHAYKLLFGIRERQSPNVPSKPMGRTSGLASNETILFYSYEPAIASRLEELFVHRSPENETRHLRNQILFHQVLLDLLERLESKHAAGEQPSMERSIAYAESHYQEKISREQLAEMAGVSPSHYSILFKQLTGFSPSDYLSRLRVHRAKELLIDGKGTLREIAQKVGYKDEFYLSRRFKQETGSPPSGYHGGSASRIAALLAPFASHLMLLGAEPAVFLSDSNEYVAAEGVEPPRSMAFISVETSLEKMRAAMIENGVDLIVAASEHLLELGWSAASLRAVAPVMELSWMELGWKEHLRRIAGFVRRSERAEQWLEEFEEEERKARLLISLAKTANDVVTILVIKPDQLLVYGARNVGYVLYRSLGLQPPERIKQEMDKQGERLHSVPIRLTELEEYAGDRILVIVVPDIKGSTVHSEKVFESSHWKGLSAVKRERVDYLEMDDWIPYNPVSIRLQLQRAVSLFTVD